MKKIFIGLLTLAAGTALYFLVIKKGKENNNATGFQKEWIIGNWKQLLSSEVTDSLSPGQHWVFSREGFVMKPALDSLMTDTLQYHWKNETEILISKLATDSTGVSYLINRLTKDSLLLQAADSTTIGFTRVK